MRSNCTSNILFLSLTNYRLIILIIQLQRIEQAFIIDKSIVQILPVFGRFLSLGGRVIINLIYPLNRSKRIPIDRYAAIVAAFENHNPISARRQRKSAGGEVKPDRSVRFHRRDGKLPRVSSGAVKRKSGGW